MNHNPAPKKKKAKKKGRFGRALLYTFFALLVVGIIGAGAVFALVKSILADTPPITNYDINTMLSENSVVYDFEGKVLDKVQDGGVRTIVQYNEIDEDIRNAFVAVEDKTFFTHGGFNYVRLVGAVIEAVGKGGSPSGTSTITQQYARNMYLPETKFAKGQAGYVRKIKEAYYTIDLEKHMSKAEILTAYLNTIDLGANVQGIQAASQRYFSKDASDVDYIEAAILAGIPKASSKYSPFTIKRNEEITPDDQVLGEHNIEYSIIFNESMISRYKTVIYLMHQNKVITDAEYETAKSVDLKTKLVPGKFVNEEISSYFIDMVKDDVIKALMTQQKMTQEAATRAIYNDGLQIYSTIDVAMQKKLEQAYKADAFTTKFDVATRRGVVAFQKKYALGTDGVAGPNTIKKLAELQLLDISLITQKTFKEGMVHEEVILLKEALEKDGLLYKRNDSLPTIEVYKDAKGNILSPTKDDDDKVISTRIVLNKYDVIIDENEAFVLPAGDFKVDNQGNLVLMKNKALNFYKVKGGYEIFIKDAYKSDPNYERRIGDGGPLYAEKVSIQEMYIFKGRSIKVPYEKKSMNDNKEVVIDSSFMKENPDFYTIDADGALHIKKDYFDISKTGIIQPQSAMVIIDYRSGELRAIIGGRNITGQRIYNRALNPRQPGSSIKPLGVYLPALDSGLTAGTVFDDVPKYDNNGRRWPQNWYDSKEFKYWGILTMREALEWSNNVIAVKIAEKLGVDKSYEFLKKLGFTTLVDTGDVNDKNLSAVALGGMAQGLTPLEVTSAYGAIANGGIHNSTITFTKVLDKNGNVLLDNTAEKTFIVDEPVAYMMHDMMYTGALRGLAKSAAFKKGNVGIPIAGKTGTTSSKHDAWFVGYSPYYVGGIWIGNDMQVPLSDGSGFAALFWKDIMGSIHADLPDKAFKTHEEIGLISMNIDSKSGKIPTALSASDPQGNTIIKEWFIPGTQPTEKDDVHVQVVTCKDSGKLATPFCPESSKVSRVMRVRLDADFNPLANLKEGQGPFAIRDGQYTVPRSAITPSADADYAELALNPNSRYCPLHTGVTHDAQTTASLLIGVETQDQGGGQKIITQSIIIKTIHESLINIDAGSRINGSGTIIGTDGTAIYPWQIASFTMNPNGPSYIPEPTTEETFPDGYGEPTTSPENPTEPPLTTEKNP